MSPSAIFFTAVLLSISTPNVSPGATERQIFNYNKKFIKAKTKTLNWERAQLAENRSQYSLSLLNRKCEKYLLTSMLYIILL